MDIYTRMTYIHDITQFVIVYNNAIFRVCVRVCLCVYRTTYRACIAVCRQKVPYYSNLAADEHSTHARNGNGDTRIIIIIIYGSPFCGWWRGGAHTPSARYPNCSPSWKKIDPPCIPSYLLYTYPGRQTAAAAPAAESLLGMPIPIYTHDVIYMYAYP